MSEITGPVSEINYNGVAVPLNASGGYKLYRHVIHVQSSKLECSLIVDNNNNEIFTIPLLSDYLNSIGCVSGTQVYPVSGIYTYSGLGIPIGIYGQTNGYIRLCYHEYNINDDLTFGKISGSANFEGTLTDTIIEL